ncbi:MAG: hypothetical protein FWC50_11510 [Planctomycetaceae bacterium]|nr:hypothetical protein [Planctomycetaceae bacterium]
MLNQTAIKICVAVSVVGILLMNFALGQTRVPTSDVYTLANRGEDSSAVTPAHDTVKNRPNSTYTSTPYDDKETNGKPWRPPMPPLALEHSQDRQEAVPPSFPLMAPPMQQPPMQPPVGGMPGMIAGPIVIPVMVPQYVTYTPPAPPPMTMVMNRPAQLVIPPYPMQEMMPMMMSPMPAPGMSNPMFTQQMMMQQQMMQQQMAQQQMMMQQQMMSPPQQPQPIPTKMILPDGSTVSIKHYVPGNFFKNVWRAVTP